MVHKSVPFVSSSTILDPNGRYAIVTGHIHSTKLILANIYAPNWDDENFFRNLFSRIPDMSSHLLVLGGDFNCWLGSLDRSSAKPTTPSKSSKIIRNFLQEFSVTDSWRFFNPTGREYSFFSPVHHTCTRIDYLFFEKIDLFIETNEAPNVSPSLLWETFKVYIRGQIMSYASYERKLRKKKISDLMTQLDNVYATSPSPNVYKDRLSLQAEFDNLTSVQTEDMLLKTRHAHYEYGDKPSKLLSHQLRQACSVHQITQIQTSTGVTTDPKLINDEFKRFYMSLYVSEQSTDPSDFDSFFSSFTVPSIDPASNLQLEEPITLEEIRRAAGRMQCSKSPGPDGFPIEFYRKFMDRIAPLLLKMLLYSVDTASLPQTMSQASISLILKKNKDPLSCGSYRPISLLNVDYKMLAKLLAMRLETVLPSIISPDQTGFIKNRYAFSNVRRLFHVMYNLSNSTEPEFVISLDAEKAFDRVEWGYLFRALGRFGLGEKIIAWIRLLYSAPLASVRTNNDHSNYFPLFRGTRQGCPLSPLLFAVAIEPLAIALRSNPSITGVTRSGLEQRVSLYADDLLLYISRPKTSIPIRLSLLHSFGSISGYKLNLDKNELFPVNAAAQEFPHQTIPFKVDKFTYLGVQVTKKF